jgi:hypothetical protein
MHYTMNTYRNNVASTQTNLSSHHRKITQPLGARPEDNAACAKDGLEARADRNSDRVVVKTVFLGKSVATLTPSPEAEHDVFLSRVALTFMTSPPEGSSAAQLVTFYFSFCLLESPHSASTSSTDTARRRLRLAHRGHEEENKEENKDIRRKKKRKRG